MVNMNITPMIFYPWGALTGATPNVPEFYWNAVSQEERWKFLCVNLDRLKDYTNSLNAFISKVFSSFEFNHTDDVNVSANSFVDIDIMFAESKESTPRVVVTLQNADGTNISANVTSVTDKGFIIRIINNSIQDTSASVSWMAYTNTIESEK